MRRFMLPMIVITALVFGLDSNPNVALGATFTVNSTGNGQDANTGDLVCETASGSGICTLRAAIEQANNDVAADTVAFDIPTTDPGYSALTNTFLIQPGSPMPVIS